MDKQDRQDKSLKHEQITEVVIGCAFEVIKELGAGFLESVYEKALILALQQKGLSAISQHPVKVLFRGQCVGDFYADIFVEEKVIVELKAVKTISPEHQAQIINEFRPHSSLGYMTPAEFSHRYGSSSRPPVSFRFSLLHSVFQVYK